ncbi:hypothetical protein DM860_003466 [Cuscuta australis]|uniref:Uncharacterized protein n=1 Tax=Cuscuta australis TaxID=267555 RepID=A0A328DG54_9ASTE|nr:hypothetical protein DM860_003466 [Cuscuta australis]
MGLVGRKDSNGRTLMLTTLCVIMMMMMNHLAVGLVVSGGKQNVLLDPNWPCPTDIPCKTDADCVVPCKDRGGGSCLNYEDDPQYYCCCPEPDVLI